MSSSPLKSNFTDSTMCKAQNKYSFNIFSGFKGRKGQKLRRNHPILWSSSAAQPIWLYEYQHFPPNQNIHVKHTHFIMPLQNNCWEKMKRIFDHLKFKFMTFFRFCCFQTDGEKTKISKWQIQLRIGWWIPEINVEFFRPAQSIHTITDIHPNIYAIVYNICVNKIHIVKATEQKTQARVVRSAVKLTEFVVLPSLGWNVYLVLIASPSFSIWKFWMENILIWKERTKRDGQYVFRVPFPLRF